MNWNRYLSGLIRELELLSIGMLWKCRPKAWEKSGVESSASAKSAICSLEQTSLSDIGYDREERCKNEIHNLRKKAWNGSQVVKVSHLVSLPEMKFELHCFM